MNRGAGPVSRRGYSAQLRAGSSPRSLWHGARRPASESGSLAAVEAPHDVVQSWKAAKGPGFPVPTTWCWGRAMCEPSEVP